MSKGSLSLAAETKTDTLKREAFVKSDNPALLLAFRGAAYSLDQAPKQVGSLVTTKVPYDESRELVVNIEVRALEPTPAT